MQNRIVRSAVLLLPIVGLAAVAFPSLARAQAANPLDPSSAFHGHEQPAGTTKPQEPPPPALPGASSRADQVAPATRIPTDMSPNDALFDAINRGDIAAARDALSRGAELNAQNVLGMTPMELSVDLGRNDISFLLLSYRSADNSSTPSSQASAATTPVQTGKSGAASRKAAAKSVAKPVAPVKTVASVAPQTPRLFANDGGAPVPNAGFLGFDTSRSER
jgi:hypothetical protein